MKGKSVLLVGTIIMLLFALNIVHASAEEKADEKAAALDCQTILLEKCTTCHTVSRFCQKLGKKSKRSWKRTIKRMVKKKDSPDFSKEEKTILLNCLSKEEDGALEACK